MVYEIDKFTWYEGPPGECWNSREIVRGGRVGRCARYHIHEDGTADPIPLDEVRRMLKLFPDGYLERYRVENE